jgi:hypothetical protein
VQGQCAAGEGRAWHIQMGQFDERVTLCSTLPVKCTGHCPAPAFWRTGGVCVESNKSRRMVAYSFGKLENLRGKEHN